MTTYKRFLQPEMGLSLAQYISNITAHLPVMMRRDIDLKVNGVNSAAMPMIATLPFLRMSV